MPDVLELASTIRCASLFIRGNQEDPDIYAAEAFGERAGCGHFDVGRNAAMCDLIAGWLTLRLGH